MTKIPDILSDKREIRCIGSPQNVENWDYELFKNGVTKIEAYRETGQCAYVPEFAVYVGDQILARVPAALVAVEYFIDEVPA